MIHAPISERAPSISSEPDGTRPALNFGTQVTPAQNAYGDWAQLLAAASVTRDCYDLLVTVNSVAITATSRDCLVTIGIDPDGGSSYVALVEHLVCGPAGTYTGALGTGGPVRFWLPVPIPSGSSVAAKASVSTSDLTALRVAVELRGGPGRPEMSPFGSIVETLGADTDNSRGTSINPGAGSAGGWTEIGTLTRPCIYLEWGYGLADNTMANNAIHVDIAIGDAGNKRTVISGGYVFTTTNESIGKPWPQGAWVNGATGDKVYARAQAGPSAADNGTNSIAVYAVGG